jgi:hypothetical protein
VTSDWPKLGVIVGEFNEFVIVRRAISHVFWPFRVVRKCLPYIAAGAIIARHSKGGAA